MKKLNKKGFTIVELVIVIAIIAVLAAIMIPSFSGVLGNAKDSAATSGARNAYTQYLNNNAESDSELADDFIYVDSDRYVAIVNGNVVDVYDNEAAALANFTAEDDEDATTTDKVEKDTEVVTGLYTLKTTHTANP